METVRLLIAKAGLPPEQTEAFWNFYESKGWMVGKNKMVSVSGAVGGWASRWRQEHHKTKTKSIAEVDADRALEDPV